MKVVKEYLMEFKVKDQHKSKINECPESRVTRLPINLSLIYVYSKKIYQNILVSA